jgi:hypothetical protein
MFVFGFVVCCGGRGLCEELITRSGGSYRLCVQTTKIQYREINTVT